MERTTYADLLQRGVFNMICGEEVFYVGIFNSGLAVAAKPIRVSQHNKFIPACAVENAGAIRKAAIGIAEVQNGAGGNLQNRADAGDGLPNFLSVSAYVLNGRAAYGAGNPAEAFNAAAILADSEGHKAVPVFTR